MSKRQKRTDKAKGCEKWFINILLNFIQFPKVSKSQGYSVKDSIGTQFFPHPTRAWRTHGQSDSRVKKQEETFFSWEEAKKWHFLRESPRRRGFIKRLTSSLSTKKHYFFFSVGGTRDPGPEIAEREAVKQRQGRKAKHNKNNYNEEKKNPPAFALCECVRVFVCEYALRSLLPPHLEKFEKIPTFPWLSECKKIIPPA